MLARLLKEGQSIRFVAQGRSMWPWIRAGDLVRVVPLLGPPRRGDVLLVERDSNDLLLHRLLESEGQRVRLKGDHRAGDDGWFDRDQVLGRLVGIERDGRSMRVSRCRALLLSGITRRFDALNQRLKALL